MRVMVTPVEADELAETAEAEGMSLSGWAREVLLEAVHGSADVDRTDSLIASE